MVKLDFAMKGLSKVLPASILVLSPLLTIQDLIPASFLNNLTGSGLLYGAGKNLTLNVTGGDVTYAGALLSGANFIKTGSGALELTNQFSHTGVTDIQGGTLAISGGGSIWNTSGVNVASGARLDLSQASAPTLNQLNMADGAALNLGSNSLVLGPYAGRCCPGPSGGQAVLWSSGIRLPQRQ
ncbi:autotransporter-associated beta strand repeat-containing protein [Brevundimonas sp. GN22]